MKTGDMMWPISKKNINTGQMVIPFWGQHPALLIEKRIYESVDPSDCQSDTVQDWRWVVLQGGEIMWMTETLLRSFFEYR